MPIELRKWFNSNVSLDYINFREGTRSIAFDGAGYIMQIVYLETGFSYIPSVYALADSAGIPALSFELYDYVESGGVPVISGTPLLTGDFDFTDKYDSWEHRHYANWTVPSSIDKLKTYTFVIRCTDIGSGINLDDIMLNRGTSVPLPYQPHATDYFYTEGLLNKIENYGTWLKIRIPTEYILDDDSTKYIELFNEIDTSEDLYVITQDVDPVTASWGSYVQYQGSNATDPKAWQVLGNNRRVDLTSAPPSTFYCYYIAQSVLILNGSLLAEGTISADHIYTNTLSAITANVGTLNAGLLNSTTYTGSVGSQIDLDNGTFTFGGGSAGTHALEWDGTDLKLKGTVDQTIGTSRTIFGGYDIGAGIVADGQVHGYYDPGGGSTEIFTLGRSYDAIDDDYYLFTSDTTNIRGILIEGDNAGIVVKPTDEWGIGVWSTSAFFPSAIFFNSGGEAAVFAEATVYPYISLQTNDTVTAAAIISDGGYCTYLNNKTGVPSLHGQVIGIDTSTANSYIAATAGGNIIIGVVAQRSIADGSSTLIKFAGKADVKLKLDVTSVSIGDAIALSTVTNGVAVVGGAGKFLGRAIEAYSLAPLTTWTVDTVYSIDDYVNPTAGADADYYFKCTARSGDFKSHATTEPTWSTYDPGDTIVDDNVTWTVYDKVVNCMLNLEHQ